MKLIGYDSDSVAESLVYSHGRYSIPNHALIDWGIKCEHPELKKKSKSKNHRSEAKNRKQLLIRDRAKCYICEMVLTNLVFTWDHVIPKSKGGRKKRECCIYCNNEKADMSIKDYIQFLKNKNMSELNNIKIKNLENYKIKH